MRRCSVDRLVDVVAIFGDRGQVQHLIFTRYCLIFYLFEAIGTECRVNHINSHRFMGGLPRVRGRWTVGLVGWCPLFRRDDDVGEPLPTMRHGMAGLVRREMGSVGESAAQSDHGYFSAISPASIGWKPQASK